MILKSILRNGFIAGGILAAYFLLLYVLGLNYFMMSFVTFLVQSLVLFFFMFKGISQVRKSNPEQKIQISNAILIASSIMVIGLFCFFLTKLILLFLIDPSYNEFCINQIYSRSLLTIEQYPAYANKIGNPENIKQLLKIENNLPSLVYYFIFSIIIGFFVGIIAKRKNKMGDSIITE